MQIMQHSSPQKFVIIFAFKLFFYSGTKYQQKTQDYDSNVM